MSDNAPGPFFWGGGGGVGFGISYIPCSLVIKAWYKYFFITFQNFYSEILRSGTKRIKFVRGLIPFCSSGDLQL